MNCAWEIFSIFFKKVMKLVEIHGYDDKKGGKKIKNKCRREIAGYSEGYFLWYWTWVIFIVVEYQSVDDTQIIVLSC